MVAPPGLARHPSWGAIIGFANQSGAAVKSSGKGSHLVAPDAKDVQVFGLTAGNAGLPCVLLKAKPALDLTSPVRE